MSGLFFGKPWSFALGMGLLLAMLSAFLTYSLTGSTRTLYLPGPTTAGHYQIELECNACHSGSFADAATLQKACVECHSAELKLAEDSHPEAKFRDPRNASRVAVLDARYCVTCHREHRPEATLNMGLTLPEDYCYRCHDDIGEERATHKGLRFDSCQTAGCHNFHDNRALYEDFLIKHLNEPATHADPRSIALPALQREKALSAVDADAPNQHALSGDELNAWLASAHGKHGTNCSDCHGKGDAFEIAVSTQRCGQCHQRQREGYLLGRHGMRENLGLPPMQVADARQPMQREASKRTLGCTSCHGAHAFDTRKAAAQACLACHADEHSKNFENSKHAKLFFADDTGQSGASCATCHLPRVAEGGATYVLHNQNDTLRPNEKMLRPVCTSCHGLGFSIDSLADAELVSSNFSRRPEAHVESLEWAASRVE